ncbi:hypothetical protein IFM89_004669 [Coptis chinensis]|uniref:Uncharacterized protein n=1 Tax=Coptis chinensis TaxID=261450 RepID=A0A835I8V9_9MAGN|nr:hypothetical protein IFM89_004669 [Coptis chinensis]
MGFLLTSIIFLVVGIVAALFMRICCNRGPSANLLHLTLVITAVVCCWLIRRRQGTTSRPTPLIVLPYMFANLAAYHQEMEKKWFQLNALAIVSFLLLLVIAPSLACSSSKGNGCRDCIADQMKYGCPACAPILRCMARCLWGGKSQSVCSKKCDCNGGKPRLSDCKKCMSRCKCSCAK